MGTWIFPVMGISLLTTIVLELLFAFLFGVRGKMDILLVVLVNVLTNPFVVSIHYIVMYYTVWDIVLITFFLEAGAVGVEWLCYKSWGKSIRNPFIFSLGANLFSYFIGKLVNYLF